jgi:hypothetical protein
MTDYNVYFATIDNGASHHVQIEYGFFIASTEMGIRFHSFSRPGWVGHVKTNAVTLFGVFDPSVGIRTQTQQENSGEYKLAYLKFHDPIYEVRDLRLIEKALKDLYERTQYGKAYIEEYLVPLLEIVDPKDDILERIEAKIVSMEGEGMKFEDLFVQDKYFTEICGALDINEYWKKFGNHPLIAFDQNQLTRFGTITSSDFSPSRKILDGIKSTNKSSPLKLLKVLRDIGCKNAAKTLYRMICIKQASKYFPPTVDPHARIDDLRAGRGLPSPILLFGSLFGLDAQYINYMKSRFGFDSSPNWYKDILSAVYSMNTIESIEKATYETLIRIQQNPEVPEEHKNNYKDALAFAKIWFICGK